MIQVFSIEDKDKLIKYGFKYVCEQNIGDSKVYLFADNNKLNFSILGVKARVTNKMNF